MLREGFTDASVLSRKSKIPMGKIYAVLDNLENMGFVEAQYSRPKKYRAIEADVAFENFFTRKESEMHRELNILRKTIDEIKRSLFYYAVQEETKQCFWSAAMGNKEVMRMVKSVYHEAKNEVCAVVPRDIRSMESEQFKDMFALMFRDTLLPLLKRGIRIRMIDPNPVLSKVLIEWQSSAKSEDIIPNISEYLKIKSLDTPHRFVLIDRNLVILEISDPLSVGRVFGMVKVYDRVLSDELHTKFEELWLNGKSLPYL